MSITEQTPPTPPGGQLVVVRWVRTRRDGKTNRESTYFRTVTRARHFANLKAKTGHGPVAIYHATPIWREAQP